MKDYLSGIIAILASFQLLFVAFFLLCHKKGKPVNNRLLGLVFLLFAISLGDFAIRISNVQLPNQLLHLIDDGFFFLYGPLLYLYVRGVVFVDSKHRAKDLLHLIPFTTYLLYLVYALFILDPEQQAEITRRIDNAELPGWIYLAAVSVYVYILIYLWMADKTINRYRKVIRNRFSSLQEINLNWLRFLIRSFAAITIISMIHNVVPALGNRLFLYISLILLLVFIIFFIIRVLVKALNQPAIFAGIEMGETREKYAGSGLSQQEIDIIYNRLLNLLEKEKTYLDPNLSISDLADRLNTTSKMLSQVINQRSGKSFFDFINTYRCDEVKHLISNSSPKVTILEIMYEAGFNSKSSFNKEFKKLNGITPTAFKKSLT